MRQLVVAVVDFAALLRRPIFLRLRNGRMPDPQILRNGDLVHGLQFKRNERMNSWWLLVANRRVWTRRTEKCDRLIAVFRSRQCRLAHLLAGRFLCPVARWWNRDVCRRQAFPRPTFEMPNSLASVSTGSAQTRSY